MSGIAAVVVWVVAGFVWYGAKRARRAREQSRALDLAMLDNAKSATARGDYDGARTELDRLDQRHGWRS